MVECLDHAGQVGNESDRIVGGVTLHEPPASVGGRIFGVQHVHASIVMQALKNRPHLFRRGDGGSEEDLVAAHLLVLAGLAASVRADVESREVLAHAHSLHVIVRTLHDQRTRGLRKCGEDLAGDVLCHLEFDTAAKERNPSLTHAQLSLVSQTNSSCNVTSVPFESCGTTEIFFYETDLLLTKPLSNDRVVRPTFAPCVPSPG